MANYIVYHADKYSQTSFIAAILPGTYGGAVAHSVDIGFVISSLRVAP